MVSTQIDKSVTAKNLQMQMKKEFQQKQREKEERECKGRFVSETYKENCDDSPVSPLSIFQDADEEFLPSRTRTRRPI